MCGGHLLAVCVGLVLSWHYQGLSVATEPGFLDFDNLPETNFSCEGKVIGGYYADTETGCQMFHVCTIGQKGEVTDIKFLCLNGTVFDQETRVCERLDEVDCSKSESFYDLNLELYGNNGAGYGIQPENEESQDELCEEEDEEDCKTEKPSAPSKPSPTEQVQPSGDESEEDETTTPPPLSSSTTSRRPVTSTFPSTTPASQVLQFPSSSPETIAALLALHNAFTQSLQQHSSSKDKVNPPKLTGFVESLNPIKSTQGVETFELKSGQSLTSRLPTPFPPKPQAQFSVPQNLPKPQFPTPPKPQFPSLPKPPQFQTQSKPLYQSPPKPQFQSPQKPQFQSPPKPQFQSPTRPQYQNAPKQPAPITQPPITFPKPVHTTSERFGNIPFRHSFHINSQISHFSEPNYHDQYSDHDSQPSSQPQTEAPKQYDFGDYEDDYYDEKPHSSTITPYLIHQLKVNQVQNTNQAKVSSVSHGSFVREVSTPSTKPFNVPSFRSVTTPGIAIITATSTTSSSSIKTSKPLPSAIQPLSKTPTASGFGSDTLLIPSSNVSQNFPPDPPQSYDEYRESDVRSDPFYKDVPKISRNKRSLSNNPDSENSVSFTDYSSLAKLREKFISGTLKINSDAILHAILEKYCSNKLNSSGNLVNYCSSDSLKSSVSESNFGGDWKIVIPQENSDYLYLVKTISSSNEYQNSTSNILLLVNFPDEFKIVRDSFLRKLKRDQESNNLLKDLDLISVNSSIHHRFKRVRRNKPQNYKNFFKYVSRWKKTKRKKLKTKQNRKKRQIQSTDLYDDTQVRLPVNAQYETPRVRPTSRRRENHNLNENQQPRRVLRKRPLQTTETQSSDEFRIETRSRESRPSSRRQQIPLRSTFSSPVSTVGDSVSSSSPAPLKSSSDERASTAINSDRDLSVRPTSKRRGQGVKYHFSEGPTQPAESPSQGPDNADSTGDKGTEVTTTYPFNLKPGTQFSCDDKIKGGYYADVEAECFGYFICSQGEINGPLLKSHFWCGPTTKFNQRSRTCQVEANVACSVSERYFHLNKDILSLPDPDDDVKDVFEPSKIPS